MGALTNNRKRDCFSVSYPLSSPGSPDSDFRADLHISKKPRVSSMQLSPGQPVSSKSAVSRISRYPEPTQSLRREVHAPCRRLKFGNSANSSGEFRPWVSGDSGKEERVDEMGNFLSYRYDQAKSYAIGALQHLRKDKEVIFSEAGCSKDVVSEDSSIEEVEILDDGREGRSVVSDQRSQQTNGDAFLQEAYAKFGYGHLQPSSSAVSDLSNIAEKLENGGKMMEYLPVNRGMERVGMLPHKKLHETAERRNSKLGYLGSQIDLTAKKWSSLLSLRPVKKSEEDALLVPFAPLTAEEEAEVTHALSGPNRRKVLVTHQNSNIEISGQTLQCLRPGAWLNDEVINLYLELLKEREKREPKKFLKCHFFNTFFYKKLISGRNGYNFKDVKRWTTQRKIGYSLIECDKIFVPIHKEIHWCLAVINKKDEKFQYLDSLKGMDTQVMEVLARYIVEEVKEKSGLNINVSSWKQEYVDDLPEQENGWDCGMFMIKYADFYSRGLGLCFKQEHMPYFRKRTVKEILRLKAE
ncbi:hypothetical protein HHK36_026512 [Tetracentron sinense]|uniref:Ubiquitin-like protease family profile domain-containing protein n=1 Tax=Tetracentron sinense TaxID=13715 RepID=A0A834YH03_TETSI|nr:hypothetical protein HHK36_026512 [Tetracentron sinense]